MYVFLDIQKFVSTTHIGRCPLHALPRNTFANILRRHFLVQYRGADKSLARPGRKQANVSVRMASISFGALLCRKIKLGDSSRLDVVEIARVPDIIPSFFSSSSG